MKKLALLLCVVLLFSGCKKEPARELSQSEQTMMEQLGVDMEDYAEMRPQEQEQLLDELGLGSGLPRFTVEDAEGPGRYIVVLSDTMGYNSFTLRYEDGVLVQVAASFRKRGSDTPLESTCSGAQLEDYHYKSIQLTAYPASELARLLSEEGFANHSVTQIQ